MTPNPNQPVRPNHEKDPSAPDDHQLPPFPESEHDTRIPEAHQRDDSKIVQDKLASRPDTNSNFWTPAKKIGAGAMALIATGGAAFGIGKAMSGSEKSPLADPTTPVATAPSTPREATPSTTDPSPSSNLETKSPSAPETPSEKATRLLAEKEKNLSPDRLKDLNPEELVAAFNITPDMAPTPDYYAKALLINFIAQYNAGCTKAEWTPYKDEGMNTFGNAMIDKYTSAVSGKATQWFKGRYDKDFARRIYNNCDVHFLGQQVDSSVPTYRINGKINPGSLVVTESETGRYNIKFNASMSDNGISVLGENNKLSFPKVEFGADDVGPLPNGLYGSPLK